MLINLKSLSLVLVMISGLYVPICNRFHTKRPNNGKITFLVGHPPFVTPSFEGNPRIRGTKFCHKKPDLRAVHGEDFVIIVRTVLIELTSVTDGQTDRQTDRICSVSVT